jgi:hypothetical protein
MLGSDEADFSTRVPIIRCALTPVVTSCHV